MANQRTPSRAPAASGGIASRGTTDVPMRASVPNAARSWSISTSIAPVAVFQDRP